MNIRLFGKEEDKQRATAVIQIFLNPFHHCARRTIGVRLSHRKTFNVNFQQPRERSLCVRVYLDPLFLNTFKYSWLWNENAIFSRIRLQLSNIQPAPNFLD